MFDMLVIKKNFTEFTEIKNICKSTLEVSLVRNLLIEISNSKTKKVDIITESFFKSRALDMSRKNITICSILKLCDLIKLEIEKKESDSLFLYLIEKKNADKKEIYESWFLDLKC